MESPHEHQQGLLLSRIITNVVRIRRVSPHCLTRSLLQRSLSNTAQEKLNEAVMTLNKTLHRGGQGEMGRNGWLIVVLNKEINVQNMNTELVAQMFKNYQSNVLFHLEATESLKEPV
ncbi:unnamed protein product [Tuber aestivum]|uniref:DASH complex subunit DAD4 n=1 Tax=Tuber aestivum TaxID=59557 RepID=A0A292PJW4_9PEZI|nr:unnamed protein product [Tuber aestivum]